MVVNLWRYKRFIFNNAVNDLRHRYAGSGMGVFWNVLNPLAQILVYTIVFSQIMVVRLPGGASTADFAIYICTGLLPWIAFSECISRGANSFIENANYLKKLPIPEQIFVAKGAVSATLSLFISMLLLFVINLFIGSGAKWTWTAVPFILLLFQCFGFGIGLMLSSFNVFFRDIGEILGIFIQMWMWLTPIVYLKDIIPSHFLSIMAFNPAYPFVDALHMSIIYGNWPEPNHWAAMAAWSLLAPVAGYLVLRKLRSEIRDVL